MYNLTIILPLGAAAVGAQCVSGRITTEFNTEEISLPSTEVREIASETL
jgi:hypothetical protein